MLRSSCTSFSMSLKALPSAARKHTEPVPVGRKSVPASSVSAALGSANSSSRFGGTGLVRPSRASRNPTCYLPRSWPTQGRPPGGLLAQLPGDLLQLLEPPVKRRVRREDLRDPAATLAQRLQRRREVERVERLCLTQVLRRDPAHLAGHLDQGAGQRRRLTGQQCP